MAARPVPRLLGDGPVLEWLDDAFGDLAKVVTVDAGCLAAGFPAAPMSPAALREQVKRLQVTEKSTDKIWAGVVAQARTGGDDGGMWKMIAAGLAVDKLKGLLWRFYAPTYQERCDVHADLTEGFYKRLATIETDRPNIANRLVDSAKGYAKRQQRKRFTHIPVDELFWLTGKLPTPGSGPHNLSEAVAAIKADFAAAKQHLDPVDLELIARTRIDGYLIATAAADFGLGVEAAYKRRQRAEARIAAFYQITGRSTPTSDLTPVCGATSPDRHATADEA